MDQDSRGKRAAEVVLPCAELGETLAYFRDELGFLLDTIYPADDPRVAILSGHGMRVRLQRGPDTPVEPLDRLPPLVPRFVVVRSDDAGVWKTGRAGMSYRDLIPGRQGGRFIASHIRIEDGGPVPDDVHYHEIRFQLIYCHRGWVRVSYEDQGPPLVMEAGDCVLQPPGIRHRVLESSAGLEVIEVGCPAEHATHLDHELRLPTAELRRAREFGGQRFVHHVSSEASFGPWPRSGAGAFECRDLGVAAGTAGAAEAYVLRRSRDGVGALAHEGELLFGFVLRGGATLRRAGAPDERVDGDDAFVLPAGTGCTLTDETEELELLVVCAPAGREA